MLIRFEGVAASVSVPDDPDFLQTLRAAAVGWSFASARDETEPVAIVRAAGLSYEIVSPDRGEPIAASAAAAACSVLVDLIGAFIEENPSRLCLHCAAVLIDGRLVVIPSRYRAGKSTLAARLAAAGYTVFCDDVMPLSEDDTHGTAIGMAPRLRLPLPQHVTADFRRFVEASTSTTDGYYAYLDLGTRLAPRGQSAPLGSILLLDRRGGPAELLRASRGAALAALITRNFARSAPAADLLDRARALMDRLPRFTLHYDDLEEAVALIERAFSDGSFDFSGLREGDPVPQPEEDRPEHRTDTVRTYRQGTRLRQSLDVKLHAVDGELFLARADGSAIHHLNSIGAGIWNFLSEPADESEAIEALCIAFPEVERSAISRDVAALLRDLQAEGLLVAEV